MRSSGDNRLKHWQHARQYITEALENRRSNFGASFTPVQVMEEILLDHAQLYVGAKCAAVCQVMDKINSDKVYIFWLAGGDRNELIDKLLPEAEEYAKSIGCNQVQYVGRLAWGKHLEKKGYDIQKVVYAMKEI